MCRGIFPSLCLEATCDKVCLPTTTNSIQPGLGHQPLGSTLMILALAHSGGGRASADCWPVGATQGPMEMPTLPGEGASSAYKGWSQLRSCSRCCDRATAAHVARAHGCVPCPMSTICAACTCKSKSWWLSCLSSPKQNVPTR